MSRSLDEVLRAVGASKASEVTLTPLQKQGSADPKAADDASHRHGDAVAKGGCVATCGAKSTGVDGSEAAALINAGAKDAR